MTSIQRDSFCLHINRRYVHILGRSSMYRIKEPLDTRLVTLV